MALTPDEQAELDSLNSSAAAPEKLSAEEQRELEQLNSLAFGGDTAENRAVDGTKMVMDLLGRGANIASGTTRVGLASLLDKAVGTKFTRPGDMSAALSGNAPSGNKLLEQGGIPNGDKLSVLTDHPYVPAPFRAVGSLYKNTRLDVTPRQAAGFATDFLDPLTVAAPVAKVLKAPAMAASAVRGVSNPLGAILEKLGQLTHASAFKKADLVAEKAGKGRNAVSKILLENRIAGGPTKVYDDVNGTIDGLTGGRQKVFNKAKEAGLSVDGQKAMTPAAEKWADYTIEPATRSQVAPLQSQIDEYAANLGDVERASTSKTRLQQLAKQAGAYSSLGRGNAQSDVLSEMAKGIDNQIDDVTAKVAQGSMGNKEYNEKLAPLLTAKKSLFAAHEKQIMENELTQVDGMLGGMLLSDNPKVGAASYVLKNLVKGWNRMGPRSKIGLGMNDLGKYYPVDATVRAGIAETRDPSMPNPWMDYFKQKEREYSNRKK